MYFFLFPTPHLSDIVLRTISKEIGREFAVPLCMHLFKLKEVEVLNLGMLPCHWDFDDQRHDILDRWKTTKGDKATFSTLIKAFQKVKMRAAAETLNRNLLTQERTQNITA